MLALERGIDRLASELAMDPVEARRKNVIRPEEFPYRTATGAEYESGNYAAALDQALQLVGFRRCWASAMPPALGAS